MLSFEWKDPRTNISSIDSVHHKHCGYCVCNCNLRATLLTGRYQGKAITISRVVRGTKLTTGHMVKKMLLQMNNLYMYANNPTVESKAKSRVQICNNIISLSSAVNQAPIPRMLSHMTLPRDSKLPSVPDCIYLFYRTWDIYYANHYLGLDLDYDFFYNCVWKDTPYRSGLPWDILSKGVLPLLNTMMIRQSWYNRCFTGDEGGRYVSAALTNIYEKIPVQLEKNNQPTRDFSDRAKELLNRCLPGALDMMYDYMGVNKYKNSIEWKWSERLVYQLAPCGLNASGYRSCPRYVDKSVPGVTKVYSGIGKKVEQYPYACAEVYKLGQKAYMDPGVDLEHPDIHSYIVPKQEKQCVYTPWGKQKHIEQEDVNNKVRFFYLLSYVVTIAAAVIGKIRHYIERGKAIKIGMTWWYGGANLIAEQLGIKFSKEMIWEDGDYSGQDRTINRGWLTLYMAGNSRYTKFPTPRDRAVHDALTVLVAKRLSVKFTNVFGKIWRVVYGGMPSGATDTSHGDSWIVACLFFLYIEDVIQKNPKIRKAVLLALRLGQLVIIIYGDDHVIGVLKSLHAYINERGFSFFVKYYFDMVIRNMRQSRSLLSIVRRDGTTCGSGIVFLQKYLIKNTIDPKLPDILPFRPIEKTVIKCAYGSKGDKWCVTDYAIAAIGMAYDSQGTNPVAYDFCREMFHTCMENIEDKHAYTKYYADTVKDTSLTRIIRKAQIPVELIREGFPSLRTLYDMHINDESRNGKYASSKVTDRKSVV